MDRFTSGYKSEYISLINEVEVKMKKIIHDSIINNKNEIATNILLLKLIKDFEKQIPEDAVDKKNMVKALISSKDTMYKNYKREMNKGLKQAKNEVSKVFGIEPNNILTIATLMGLILNNLDKLGIKDVTEPDPLTGEIIYNFTTKGFPYIENYFKQIRDSIDGLVEEAIKEPKTKKGVLSIRSMVELQLRQEFHNEQKESFDNQDIKIVRISSHADCSKRCEPYQNKLYSLNHTSGSIDGEKYEPIENATDIFVKTKNGRVWKNGLFGFNCRHRMIKYEKDMPIQQDYTHEEIVHEREVAEKQRAMERMVFKTREKAILEQSINPKNATALRKKATKLYQNYVKYSQENNHAFYPDRCAISRGIRTIILNQK